jgi:multiple sugar transport system permease protein
MDGAGIWSRFRHIAIPLSKPIICTLAVMNILFTWNDIIWPWIAISEDKLRTISIGMSIFQRAFAENYGPMFAGFAVVSIPLIILFLFTTRAFISGLTSGAFKA